MPSVDTDEVRFQLRRAILRYADAVSQPHRWLAEQDRWKELVFAILTRAIPIREATVRVAVDTLGSLGLLNVSLLASDDAAALQARHRALAVLAGEGFDQEQSDIAFRAMTEAAKGMQLHFQGKVQRYLRHYGELMLGQIDDYFQFTDIPPPEVKDAFSYWLQNVASMPLPLHTEEVRRYCDQQGIDEKTLRAVADEIDINFAFLDDIIAHEVLGLPATAE
jgi:hypothetical protein